MNVAQMLFSNNVVRDVGDLSVLEKQGNANLPMFQQMLENLFARNGDVADELQSSLGIMGPKGTQMQLTHFLKLISDGEVEDKHLEKDGSIEQMLIQFEMLMMQNTGNHANTVSEKHIDTVLSTEMPEHIHLQLSDLITEIKAVLTNVVKKGNLTESATKLVHLLERWSALNHLVPVEQREGLQAHVSNDLEDPELQKMWRNLLTAYERRSVFNQNNQYHTESKVDQKDVLNWLQRTLHNERSMQGSNVPNSSQMNTGVPMSRVEQYVIYVQQNENAQAPAMDDQLIEKFQQALRTSRFLAMNNGPSQMLFNLKPDNLGEMMVRLTEINGEMTAKIIVTSESTRKALQSNIHQLKNMFSPHQVVIERQDELTSQQVLDKQEQASKNDEEDKQSHEHDQEENKDQQEQKESFREILNEKV